MLSRRLIRIKTIQSLYSHFCSAESSLIRSEKEYRQNLTKCYELYVMMLGLIVEVADYAQKRIDIGRAKMRPSEEEKNPNLRFVENKVVEMLRQSEALAEHSISGAWSSNESLIKDLYNLMVSSAYYQSYMSSPSCDFAADKKVVINFYKNHIEDNEEIEAALEEMSIFWNDDTNFVLGHVITTLNSLKAGSEDVGVLPMYKNDDDKEYAEVLYRKAVVNSKQYFGYIERFAQNWDFDRIAFMDKLIIEAAITELIQFPSIPVKVTLDEFIEISKYYSTSNSSTFINGIIDKAIETLTAEGVIVKSGRGLIES